MDEALRCRLCADYYQSAVVIADPNCGHSFCSECIRQHFRRQLNSVKRDMKCPICRFCVKSDMNKCLVPNRILQEVVLAFRESLTASKGIKQTNNHILDSAHPQTRGLKRARENGSFGCPPDNGQTKRNAVKMDKKPLPNYAGKSKKKLQELCTKEGLPTFGTTDEVKDRHAAFITLWNAETDSICPRPPRKLVEIIVAREAQRRTEEKSDSAQTDHKSLQAMFANGRTSGSRSFDRKLAKGFGDLINNLRAQKSKQRTGGDKQEIGDKDGMTTSGLSENDGVNRDIGASMQELSGIPEEDSSKIIASEVDGGIANGSCDENSIPTVVEEVDHPTNVSSNVRATRTFTPPAVEKKPRTTPFSTPKLWTCVKCTFVNIQSRRFCEMCSTFKK